MVPVGDGDITEQTVAKPGSPVISVDSRIMIRRDEDGCRSDSNFYDSIQKSSVGTGDVEFETDPMYIRILNPDTEFVVTSHRYLFLVLRVARFALCSLQANFVIDIIKSSYIFSLLDQDQEMVRIT